MRCDRFALTVEACVRGLAALGALCAVALFFCVAFDVVGREVFGISTDYAIDMSELLMVPLVFLVLPYVAQVGANVKVDIVLKRTGPRLRFTFELISHILFLLFVALIGWGGWLASYDAYRFGSITQSGIAIWPALVPIPLSSALLCAQVLVLIGRHVSAPRSPAA